MNNLFHLTNFKCWQTQMWMRRSMQNVHVSQLRFIQGTISLFCLWESPVLECYIHLSMWSNCVYSTAQLPNHDSPFQLSLTPHLLFQMYPLPCRLVHYPVQKDTYFRVRCCNFSESDWTALKPLVKNLPVASHQISSSNVILITINKTLSEKPGAMLQYRSNNLTTVLDSISKWLLTEPSFVFQATTSDKLPFQQS